MFPSNLRMAEMYVMSILSMELGDARITTWQRLIQSVIVSTGTIGPSAAPGSLRNTRTKCTEAARA